MLDRTTRKGRRHRHAGKTPVGRRRPVPRQLRAEGAGVFWPHPGLDLFALCRGAFCRAAGGVGAGDCLAAPRSRVDEPTAYHAAGVLYLAPEARFDYLRQFDFVLANPPFNVNAVDKERLKEMVGRDAASPLACRAPTMPTICGFSSSIRRSTTADAPAL